MRGNIASLKLNVEGLMKTIIAIFSIVSTLALANIEEVQNKIYQQPIQIFCDVSTRVVASQLSLGVNPLSGALYYTMKKYHATESAENFQLSGMNLFGMDQKLTFDRGFGNIGITGSNVIATRVEYKQLYASFHFVKENGKIKEPNLIQINGKFYDLGGPISCTVVGE